MNTITRKLEFDAGHRVLNHEGKCRHLHGHRYVVELTLWVEDLDALGRVIDFSVVKSEVGTWIDDHLDHNMLLHPDDPMLCAVEYDVQTELIGRQPFVMPPGYENPTAENISAVIGLKAAEILQPHSITVVSLRLYETPNCWADWTPNSL